MKQAKRLFSLLLALTLVLTCAPQIPLKIEAATIASGKCGANVTWALDEEGTLTISGRGPMYNAETFNDTPWAAHRLDIKKVTIGSSVTTIGDNAFESCPSLTSVTIGDSVTTIGSYVFYECSKLTSVTIGNSVTTIGGFTFSGCTGLTSITIPNSVTTIGSYAFYECSKLTSVTIGNSVTTIGECAFDTCRSLTSVTIPNSVTTIGRYAFWNCDVLTKIYFDGSAPAIGNDALCNVTATAYYYPDETWTEDMMQKYGSKITWVALEKGPEIIASGKCGANVTWALDEEGTLTISGSGPMYNCETANDVPWADHRNDIKKVIIGDSVTTIGSFMFSYCSRLTSIDIPDSVTTIGFNAFHECTELSCLVIPASVTLIDYYAFYNCICLDEIYFEGSAPRICVDVFYNTEPTSVTAYYYPDETWTEDVMQDYGGNITWVALGSTVLCGDFTGDGYITDEDVIYLLWYTVFPEDYPLNQSGDIDGDSFVTDADVIYLLWHTVFPEDYPIN